VPLLHRDPDVGAAPTLVRLEPDPLRHQSSFQRSRSCIPVTLLGLLLGSTVTMPWMTTKYFSFLGSFLAIHGMIFWVLRVTCQYLASFSRSLTFICQLLLVSGSGRVLR